MRTLLLMRHAKSDWEADYGSDHDRPLNKRGIRNARLMGRVLAASHMEPSFVISSTAIRASATAELAIEAGRWESELRLDRSLYESGPKGVLEAAARAPDVECLMLVGHQPTWSMLVAQITGSSVDMKTASVAAVDLHIDSWRELPEASGALSSVLHPRHFVGSEWYR